MIEEYTPVMASDQWDPIAAFVRNAVHSYSPSTVSVARVYLAATAQFVQWSWKTAGLDVGVDIVHPSQRRSVHQPGNEHEERLVSISLSSTAEPACYPSHREDHQTAGRSRVASFEAVPGSGLYGVSQLRGAAQH